MIEEIGGARLKKSDFIGINECFKPIEREYKRGEIITTYSPENKRRNCLSDNRQCRKSAENYFFL